ncbi:hypothetical protein CIP107547_01141 [Corynebacterium diphtheriae]|uniref:Uncharacterized protein n=1 Tax=Corynebacterium diphtheriae TaxID=1717 RepID=A0A811G3A0_CORDP|nr:hypothetical protein CIP107547_01141 [Corynebacterium diphtheriae]
MLRVLRQPIESTQVAQIQLLLEIRQQLQDLVLNKNVEGRDCLIENDHLGVQRECSRDGDALALTTRELVGVSTHRRAWHSNHVEQLSYTLLPLFSATHLVH